MTDLLTDATRLQMLQALGGVSLSVPTGTFVGQFEIQAQQFGDVPIDDVTSSIVLRTSDVERCRIAVGQSITHERVVYVVRSIQPDDAGFTTLFLEGP